MARPPPSVLSVPRRPGRPLDAAMPGGEWPSRATRAVRAEAVMGHPRPARGLLAQILYDAEAFHRRHPALFRPQTSGWR